MARRGRRRPRPLRRRGAASACRRACGRRVSGPGSARLAAQGTKGRPVSADAAPARPSRGQNPARPARSVVTGSGLAGSGRRNVTAALLSCETGARRARWDARAGAGRCGGQDRDSMAAVSFITHGRTGIATGGWEPGTATAVPYPSQRPEARRRKTFLGA